MNDLISRRAAIDALDEQIEQCDKSLSSFDISLKDEYAVKVERASLVVFRETLEYLQHAEPRTGKWKNIVDGIEYTWGTCDTCGARIPMPYKYYEYCPHCGMKNEVTE